MLRQLTDPCGHRTVTGEVMECSLINRLVGCHAPLPFNSVSAPCQYCHRGVVNVLPEPLIIHFKALRDKRRTEERLARESSEHHAERIAQAETDCFQCEHYVRTVDRGKRLRGEDCGCPQWHIIRCESLGEVAVKDRRHCKEFEKQGA